MDKLIEQIRKHPRVSKIGMIACHLGIVRGTSRNGQPIKELNIWVDHEKLEEIMAEIKKMSGIIEVLVETNEGVLRVGETIMAVAVAGDIREHVFPGLKRALNRIKSKAIIKREV